MSDLLDRINQAIMGCKRTTNQVPKSLRLGRIELEELRGMCYESVPSERVIKGGERVIQEWLDRIGENHRGFRTGEHFMGLPIVRMEEDSYLEAQN